MNPVLLKPGSDRRSHVVVMGRPAGELRSGEFAAGRTELARAAFAAYDDLAGRYDVVVCEGAGSPAEINLRAGDYVNMGLARHAAIPTVRGRRHRPRGCLRGHARHPRAARARPTRRWWPGFVVNKFRGDVALLRPGLDTLERLTGRPVLGVLPWLHDLLAGLRGLPGPAPGTAGRLRRWWTGSGSRWWCCRGSPTSPTSTRCAWSRGRGGVVDDPRALAGADVVVLPGTRATLADLAWLRERGLADAVLAHAAAGRPVLGICGGFQMLGREVRGPGRGRGHGRGEGRRARPARRRPRSSAPEKVLRLPTGEALGVEASGYEIHHGRVDGGRRGAVPGRRPLRCGLRHHVARQPGG